MTLSSHTIKYGVKLLAERIPKLIGAHRCEGDGFLETWNGGDKDTHLSIHLPGHFLRWTRTPDITSRLAPMSNLSRPLARLSQPTRARLRSSQILTTLAQIVSELVQNSLDAGAKHVDVGIDAEEWECWVRDDGCGVSRENLGKLEGRYSEWMHNMV